MLYAADGLRPEVRDGFADIGSGWVSYLCRPAGNAYH